MPAKIQDALDELSQNVNQFKSNTLIAIGECRRSADGTYRGLHSHIYNAYLEAYDTVLAKIQLVGAKYHD